MESKYWLTFVLIYNSSPIRKLRIPIYHSGRKDKRQILLELFGKEVLRKTHPGLSLEIIDILYPKVKCPYCNIKLLHTGLRGIDKISDNEYYEYFIKLCPNCLRLFATKFIIVYDNELGKYKVLDHIDIVEIGRIEIKIPMEIE